MPDCDPVLPPREQLRYNVGLLLRAAKIFRWGAMGCFRAVLQLVVLTAKDFSNNSHTMSRENNERLWKILCALMALCLGMIGWYASEISSDLHKANDGITALAVQVARLETRMDGIEKRLDTGVSGIEPSKFKNVAVR